MVIVKFQKLTEKAVMPSYAHPGDAGMDLTAISKNATDLYIEYGTGLAVEIPDGYVGLIFPRSSSSKTDLILANCVGVIDSGYRGEISVRFKNTFNLKDEPFRGHYPIHYNIRDRVAQLIILETPSIIVEEVAELKDSHRGANGYGSTGR